LELDIKYYYVVSVRDKNGNESLPSDTVSYKLIKKATALDIDATSGYTNPTQFIFSALYDDDQTGPGEYAMRIRGEDNLSENGYEIVYRTGIIDVNFEGNIEAFLSGEELNKIFDKGGFYQWRIDLFQGSNTGSETQWTDFPEPIIWGN